MPAVTASQDPGRSLGKSTETPKARTVAPTKKRRVTRRRGRARGELDSDDEIEREAATDESDSEDDLSDNSSATDDSDTEPVSEDVITHDRTHLPTPRNSKSPDSVGKGDPSPFFAPGPSWSEMVDEGANESGDLPVVDFAEFGTKPLPPPKALAKKAKKAAAKAKKRADARAPVPEPSKPEDPAPAPTVADRAEELSTTATDPKRVPQSSRHPLPGHSARQLYQQKLESDPSYVPTIGNFWSHDDRLIDTELRNLSGWWRGRGGRGRGRGGFAVRGRGAFHGVGGREGENQLTPDENLPPVDKAWTHDGFEEMKKRDEKRRAEQAAVRKAQESPKHGFAGRGGRGGFVPGRGRGVVLRGGFGSPVNGRNNSPFNRVRYAMKPELMWTKQHEAFLYFDSTMKPRPGQGAGFRIRVPGQEDTQVVRAPPTSASRPVASASKPPSTASQEEFVVVRLPKRSGKGKQAVTPATRKEQSTSSTSTQPEIGSKLLPIQAAEEPSVVPLPTQLVETLSEPLIVSQIEQISLEPTLPNPERTAMTEQAVLRNSSHEPTSDVPEPTSSIERPVLPPLQTTFTPPPPPPPPQPISQPSPAYGSPYSYSVPLPPGIAMNAHGMPYEMATGRPVYLQPPTTVYNPRPMMHYPHPSMTFHPGHMQHPSLPDASPDFLAQPPSHTPPSNGFIDPATGTPIFSFPRQTTRVEIRAPAGSQVTTDNAKPASAQAAAPRTPSGLRTTAPTFQPQPTRPIGYYQQSIAPADSADPTYDPNPPASSTSGHAHSSSFDDAAASMGGGVMQPYPGHYPHPPQAYYYPDPYGGYPPYMDMSHAGQGYDMYGMEQTPQGTVYY